MPKAERGPSPRDRRTLLSLAGVIALALSLSACAQTGDAALPSISTPIAVAATSTTAIVPISTFTPTATAIVGVTYGGAPKEAAPVPATATATSTAGATPVPSTTLPPALTASVADIEAQTPPRDLIALAERLRHIDPVVGQPTAPVDYPVGYQTTFNVADQLNRRYFAITATVRVKTAHAYFYVQDDLPYDAAGLQQAAQTFESRIYPTDTSIYGLPREPGMDGDRRISIVNANIPGVGGYFSASDEYPVSVVPYSNQRNAIYINAGAERIGSTDYLSTIAHEFQHMIHWNVRPHDDSWLNEGMSILAQHLNGYPVGAVVPLFLGSPDTQLDAWAADAQGAVPHYGAADLFLEYFTEHYGGPQIIKELLASKATDLQMFSNYLRRHDPGTTFTDVFADWVVADELNNPTIAGGRYAFTNRSLHATLSIPPLTVGAPRHDTVHPYATLYYEIPGAAATGTLRFQGTTSVPLMHQPAPAGVEWWGNRADTMDTTLTRAVDLRDVATAQLDFSLWMDIENSYDYFYVEASQDGGASWTTLPGTHSSTDDPNGQNYGNGYTGKSAEGSATPGWWQEQVGLTPYAGEQLLLRFEYVTDEAYSGPGVALANLRIPDIGYDDAAGGYSGWTSSGWLLTDNTVPEQFIVQVIANGATPAVYRMDLDVDNRGSLPLAPLAQAGQSVVVVVSAIAPKTSEAGAYTLQIGQ
jgi:immune inhibitor A